MAKAKLKQIAASVEFDAPNIPNMDELPPANPRRAVVLSDMPRYAQNQDRILPEELRETAEMLVKLSRLGMSWSHMAGRLGLFPDELRKLCMAYPDLARAAAYGAGVASEEMTNVVYEKAVEQKDLSAAMFWLKARGGFDPPPQKSTSISVTSGDVTVSVDLDRLRDMAAEQATLIDGEFKNIS